MLEYNLSQGHNIYYDVRTCKLFEFSRVKNYSCAKVMNVRNRFGMVRV